MVKKRGRFFRHDASLKPTGPDRILIEKAKNRGFQDNLEIKQIQQKTKQPIAFSKTIFA